jgi:hypothetical protein
VNVEHFGFLSSVFRKRESHEQDGETLPRECARNETATGDPAMAFPFFLSVGTDGRFRPAYSAAVKAAHATASMRPPTTRADIRARKILNGEC